MTRFAGKTYWIVGASEGLGREIARQLAAQGADLILSARSEGRLTSLAQELPSARVLALDVTDQTSVRHAEKALGAIDGVVYNVGTYEPMRTQNWDTDKALQMVDVNLLGAMRVLGAIIPDFIARQQGDITLIGSLAGYRGLPASVGYSTSKAGLVSLAETLRFDLRGSGVVVRLVNPGFIKTRLTDKNDFRMPQLMQPDAAAARVVRAMGKKRFRTDFPAPFSWVIRLIHWLPDALIYRFG